MKKEYDVVAAGHICLDISLLIESTRQNEHRRILFAGGCLINLSGACV